MTTRSAEWTKPGPGTWDLDRSHVKTPGPIVRDLFTRAMDEGMAQGCELFGAPIAGMQARWVNGRFYRRIVPLVGGGRDLPTPPKPILWLATRVHPEFRRREKRARDTFEHRRWGEEVERWESDWRPRLVAANEGFTDVDVDSLDDAELASHLAALHEHLIEGTTLHFRLAVSSIGPMGILMVTLRGWGLDVADAFDALIHASPATRSTADASRAIAEALASQGLDPATIGSLGDVEAAGGTAAQLLSTYLLSHGWRLTSGYDLEDRTLREMPELMVNAIRQAGAAPDPAMSDAAIAKLRSALPERHREEFDSLVTSARASYGLRDENGPITYEWPAGLMRRALRAAGTRLSSRGRLNDAAHVFELGLAEVAGALSGSEEPTATEVAVRAEERAWWSTLDAPARLGPEEVLPPISVMPEHLGRLTDVVLTVMGALEAEPGAEPLRGLGLGDEVYTGTARVVTAAEDAFASLEPGDVLVAPFTSPTYNAVLAIAGAVVTEEGGLLCHAAVIAREFGLPAVIGAAEATSRIPDGSTVEVDPLNGRVRVLT